MLIQAPQLGWILGFCAMASLGLPGLAGFWGEFPAILSAYSPAPTGSVGDGRCSARYMVIAALGTVLAAGYLLWLLPAHRVRRRRRDGVRRNDAHDPRRRTRPEWIAWTPLLVAHRRARRLPEPDVRASSTAAVDAARRSARRAEP